MLVVMKQQATPEQIDAVVADIEKKGCTARPIPGGERVAIGVLHNKGALEASHFLALPGVKDAIPVTKPYKLVSREFQPEETIIKIGDVVIGGGHFNLIAGPCAVETENQVVKHLDEHLNEISTSDLRSRAVLEQMREDEAHHASVALHAGAANLPESVKKMMRLLSKVMTKTAYWI